ncbi:hypothetical protein FLA_3146 [Filimonas lacunae]|nr:hypothetical protein FLA_3146 [Filimonas lacunae]
MALLQKKEATANPFEILKENPSFPVQARLVHPGAAIAGRVNNVAQLQLTEDLPIGQLFKSTVTTNYMANLDASIAYFKKAYNDLNIGFALCQSENIPAPKTTELRTLYLNDVFTIKDELDGQFSKGKQDRFRTKYDKIKKAEETKLKKDAEEELGTKATAGEGLKTTIEKITKANADAAPRYNLLKNRNVPLPLSDQLIALVANEPANMKKNLVAPLDNIRLSFFYTKYNELKDAEKKMIKDASDERNEYFTADELLTGRKSADVITERLGKMKERTGSTQLLFGDDIDRNDASKWTFTYISDGQPDVKWDINIVTTNANPLAFTLNTAFNANTVTITVNNAVVPATQQKLYQEIIINQLAFDFRAYKNVAGNRVLVPGGNALAPLSENDKERIGLFKEVYKVYTEEKKRYVASAASEGSAYKLRLITERLDTMVKEMHLDNDAKHNLFKQELGNSSDVDDLKFKTESHVLHKKFEDESGAAGFNAAQDIATTGVRVITPSLIEHMIKPEKNDKEFKAKGIGGGHDEGKLRAFLLANADYDIVQEGGDTVINITINGLVRPLRIKKFKQYRWTGAANAIPPLAANRPPASLVNWEVAQVPKTTASDLLVMLHEGRKAYLNWLAANPGKKNDNGFGRINPADAAVPVAESDNNVRFGGFGNHDPVNDMRQLDTIFPII